MTERRSERPPVREGTASMDVSRLLKDQAQKFVNGTIAQEGVVVFEGDKSTIARLFEVEEQIPGTDNGRFHLDYRRYKEQADPWPVQLRFEYDEQIEGDLRRVAEMHIVTVEEGVFGLVHRYVTPEDRPKKGVGAQLHGRVEEWAKGVANEKGSPVSLMMESGQKSVNGWAKKLGYEPATEDDLNVLKEISEYPEHFLEAEVEDNDDQIQKDVYLFREGVSGRTRDDTVKVILVKEVKPDAVSEEG